MSSLSESILSSRFRDLRDFRDLLDFHDFHYFYSGHHVLINCFFFGIEAIITSTKRKRSLVCLTWGGIALNGCARDPVLEDLIDFNKEEIRVS